MWRATQEADKPTPSARHFPLYRRKPIRYLGTYPQHFMAHNLRSRFDRQKQRKSTFDTPVSKQHLLQGRTYTPCILQGVTHYTLKAKFVWPSLYRHSIKRGLRWGAVPWGPTAKSGFPQHRHPSGSPAYHHSSITGALTSKHRKCSPTSEKKPPGTPQAATSISMFPYQNPLRQSNAPDTPKQKVCHHYRPRQ